MRIVTLSALTLFLVLMVSPAATRADEAGALAPQLAQAEYLLKERKFNDCLEALQQIVAQKEADRATAAIAQYRLGLYRSWIKKGSIEKLQQARDQWLPIIEADLRKVITDFPEQTEAVNLARVELVGNLMGQKKFDEAQAVGQQLLDATPDSPRYQALGRLKLIGVDLARILAPGTAGKDIHAAYVAAIPQLDQVIATASQSDPDVANSARLELLYALVFTWQFDRVPAVCQAVLADHAAGRADDKQAGWALIHEATALTRQERFEEAIGPLEMAAAIGDPNHLDVRYRAQGDLRKVYEELVRQSCELGISALFGDDDPDTAQLYFEDAHAYSLEAGGFRLEEIRMHLARLAQRKEDFDRAIAWWRMAIGDPAKLAGGGTEGSEVIAWLFREKKNEPDQEEAWRLYLLDPEANEDPTGLLVSAELGTVAPAATEQVPTMTVPDRLAALGKLYLRQRRLTEAEIAFQEALQTASTDHQRGEALFGLVNSTAMQSEDLRMEGRDGEAQALFAQAEQYATEAVEAWLQVTLNGPRTDAHYATERALYGFTRVGDYGHALVTAERFLDELGPDAEASKIAFAQYMRMRALAWNRRYAEAAQAGTVLQQQFAPHDNDGRIRTICEAALIRTTDYYCWAGDPQAGLATLDFVEAEYPDGFTDWIASVRERVSRFIESE